MPSADRRSMMLSSFTTRPTRSPMVAMMSGSPAMLVLYPDTCVNPLLAVTETDRDAIQPRRPRFAVKGHRHAIPKEVVPAIQGAARADHLCREDAFGTPVTQRPVAFAVQPVLRGDKA